jgi:hypothetical protein
MAILDTIKNLFGGKATDLVNSATSQVTDAVTNAAANLINFDDINVEKFKGQAQQFGLMDKLPESIKSKLEDGTLSDEDLKSFIPEIKEMIMSKMGK